MIIIIPDTLAIPATFIIAAVNLRLYTLINVTSTIGKREREREREGEGGREREREGEREGERETEREGDGEREGEEGRERNENQGVTEKVKCNNY